MKMNKKRLVALGLTGAMAVSSAACFTSQAEEKTLITMSSVLTNEAQRIPFEENVLGAIEQAQPNIDMELQVYSDRQNIMVEVAGGAGPDILDLDGPTDVVEFADAGKAIDLTPYAEKYGWKDLIAEWAYNTCVYQDKLYSLPGGFEGMGMYYNMDVMEEYGWSIPQDLDELETLMQEIKDAGLMPIAFGNANYQGAVDHLYSTMLSCYAGPEVVKQAVNGEIPWDDPRMVEAIAKFKEWFDKGYISDGASQTITQDDQAAFLAQGRAVMMISGTWSATSLVQTYPELNWTFQLMPVLNDEVGAIFPLAVGEAYAISGNSENPDACAEALNLLFSDENIFYNAVNTGAIQPFPLKDFDISELKGLDEKVLQTNEVMTKAASEGNVGYCSWCFWPAQARVYMNENFDAVLLGTMSPEDYMKNTQEYIDKGLEDGSTPVLP